MIQKNRILIIFFIMVIISGITTIVSSGATSDIYVNQTGWWRADGAFNASATQIQAAIDAATAGETIYVYNGNYTENVNVTKQLTLRGIGMPVVNASDSGSAINLSADGITLVGFTATGGGIYPEAGIRVNSNSNNLSGNNASNNGDGITLISSSNNTLRGNNANSNNQNGIWLDYLSNNNTITNNNASSNTLRGIYLNSASNNTIYNNYFNNTNNSQDDGYNVWNVTKTAGTNIIGGSWLGGNYWSDYTEADMDSDGLGDTLTPYNIGITNGGDYHPLMTVGTIAPPITIISPVNTTYNNASIVLNVTTNQTANVTYSINGAENQ
ncbi:MAG TPA: NosD domain-containing protein, partial [Candidatus Methanoperedens sp.]|nr:NosD domain-containing protein [Candidatus Methanoperedens sp.]